MLCRGCYQAGIPKGISEIYDDGWEGEGRDVTSYSDEVGGLMNEEINTR